MQPEWDRGKGQQVKRETALLPTIDQPINSELNPLGREAARSDTIYALSCSLEKGQSVQRKV